MFGVIFYWWRDFFSRVPGAFGSVKNFRKKNPFIFLKSFFFLFGCGRLVYTVRMYGTCSMGEQPQNLKLPNSKSSACRNNSAIFTMQWSYFFVNHVCLRRKDDARESCGRNYKCPASHRACRQCASWRIRDACAENENRFCQYGIVSGVDIQTSHKAFILESLWKQIYDAKRSPHQK